MNGLTAAQAFTILSHTSIWFQVRSAGLGLILSLALPFVTKLVLFLVFPFIDHHYGLSLYFVEILLGSSQHLSKVWQRSVEFVHAAVHDELTIVVRERL